MTTSGFKILIIGKGEGNLISHTRERLCLLSWLSYPPALSIQESLSKLLSVSGKTRQLKL